MKKKKILALVLAASMAGGMLAGCGSTSGGDETAKGDKSSGKVYYLNFKPEQADQWVELAKEYTDETGVKVDVTDSCIRNIRVTAEIRDGKRRGPNIVPGKRTGWTCYMEGLLL